MNIKLFFNSLTKSVLPNYLGFNQIIIIYLLKWSLLQGKWLPRKEGTL